MSAAMRSWRRIQLGQVGSPWTFVGLGTFQAGDTSDMLLRNTSTGGFEAYYISNNNITNASLIGTVGTDWNFAGTGDFDGQSSLSELLLRNAASGSFELYQVAGGGVLSGSSVAAVGNNLQVSGFGNFSGSSTTQMIMEQANEAPGTNAYWLYTYNASSAAFAGTRRRHGRQQPVSCWLWRPSGQRRDPDGDAAEQWEFLALHLPTLDQFAQRPHWSARSAAISTSSALVRSAPRVRTKC